MKEMFGIIAMVVFFVVVAKPEAIGHWWHQVEAGFAAAPTPKSTTP